MVQRKCLELKLTILVFISSSVAYADAWLVDTGGYKYSFGLSSANNQTVGGYAIESCDPLYENPIAHSSIEYGISNKDNIGFAVNYDIPESGNIFQSAIKDIAASYKRKIYDDHNSVVSTKTSICYEINKYTHKLNYVDISILI
ncbi:hypothetical protein OAP56_03245, partial [Rickettsiaceae bacterium]|nr:hypothetical protein [Rickettsiaceae bacterium]